MWAGLVLLGVALAGPELSAQQSVSPTGVLEGVVVDSSGGRIVGVELVISNTRIRGFSNDTGGFRLLGVPAGRNTVRLRRLGYAPNNVAFIVEAGTTERRELAMTSMPTTVNPVVVTAPRRPEYTGWAADFYRRRDQSSGGRFITREEIERRNPTHVTDLIRSLPGVQIRPSSAAGRTVFFRGNTCPPFVWIDNAPALAGYFDIDNVQPGSLEGIEVYSSVATMPSELVVSRNRAGCGMIVLWTKMPDRPGRDSRTRYTAMDLANMVSSLRVYTADQVDSAARFTDGNPLNAAYPLAMRSLTSPTRLVVEFIVDSTGRVEMDTFGVVSPAATAFVESVRTALPSSRFVPAVMEGRRVRQLVQLSVRFDPPEQQQAGADRVDR